MKESKIIRRIILAILLICTAFLIYSIVTNPLGEHDIMFALAVTAGFIAFIYWREAVFGGIVVLVGLIGIINELTNFLGKLTLLELVIFLGSFLWFQNSLKTAREKFLHI